MDLGILKCSLTDVSPVSISEANLKVLKCAKKNYYDVKIDSVLSVVWQCAAIEETFLN